MSAAERFKPSTDCRRGGTGPGSTAAGAGESPWLQQGQHWLQQGQLSGRVRLALVPHAGWPCGSQGNRITQNLGRKMSWTMSQSGISLLTGWISSDDQANYVAQENLSLYNQWERNWTFHCRILQTFLEINRSKDGTIRSRHTCWQFNSSILDLEAKRIKQIPLLWEILWMSMTLEKKMRQLKGALIQM